MSKRTGLFSSQQSSRAARRSAARKSDDSSNAAPSPAPGNRSSRPTCRNHGRVTAAPLHLSGTTSGEKFSFGSCAWQIVAATKVSGAARGAFVVGFRLVPIDVLRRGRAESAAAATRQPRRVLFMMRLPVHGTFEPLLFCWPPPQPFAQLLV